MSDEQKTVWDSLADNQAQTAKMQAQLLAAGAPERIFSEPVTTAGQTVITAGESVTAYGYGHGGGGETTEKGSDGGTGGGGGGYTLSRPVAVIIINEGGVRLEPIMDITKVSIAMFTAGAAIVASLARIKRRA